MEQLKISAPWQALPLAVGILLTVVLYLVLSGLMGYMRPMAEFWLLFSCAVLASGVVGRRWRLLVPVVAAKFLLLLLVSIVNVFWMLAAWFLFLFALLAFGFIWFDWFGSRLLSRQAAGQKKSEVDDVLRAAYWVARPGGLLLSKLFPVSADFLEPSIPTVSGAASSAFQAAGALYFFTLLVELAGALGRSVVYFFISLVGLLPLYVLIFLARRERYYGPLVNMFGVETNEYGYNYGAWLLETSLLCVQISLVVGLLLGFWPILASLFHALFPVTRSGAGAIEVESLGAREPTREELATILDALAQIRDAAGKAVAAPSQWLVIDEASPDAYTIGSTVYLSRAAVESPHLPGIMAHEMGHIAHKDGDLILALRRFIVPLAYYIGIDRHPMPAGAVLKTGAGLQSRVIRTEDEKIYYRFKALQIKLWLAFWCGGLGMFLLGRQWAAFWRERDHLADRYAVDLGQEELLMDALTLYRHVDVAQPFLLTNRPYTAERLDRLQG